MFIVYKHTNNTNGKAYVGFTKLTLEERFRLHVGKAQRGSMALFHRALAKYGTDVWHHEVLEICASKRQASEAEVRLVAKHGTLAPDGYNMTRGGEGGEMGKEARARYDAAVYTPAMSALRRANGKRQFQDPQKVSRHLAAISRPEAKRKQSEALKVTNALPEVRLRRSAAQVKAQNDGETRRKKSASMKAASQRPEVKAQRSRTSLEVHNRPSIKRAKSDKMKKVVEQISHETGGVIATFPSVKEASVATQVHYTNIAACASGHRRHAGGFLWRYVTRDT